MIRPLRNLHRRAFLLIAAAVPALLIAGLLGRAPQANVVPDEPTTPATLEFESEILWRSEDITTRIFSTSDPKRQFFVELEARSPLANPDLLLYWSAQASQGTLPNSAMLLGPYSGGAKRFTLPAGEAPRTGMLILYDLARRAVVATAEAPNDER